MKRGLVFAKYGPLAASTRQRFVQAIPYLQREDIAIDIHPLFDNAHLKLFFEEGKHRPLSALKAYAKRVADLFHARQYDFIWVQYELFPYLPGWLETLITLAGKPIIVDFDDAIFHQYDDSRHPLVRALLGNKLAPLLKRSDLAFCGNRYLAEYVGRYCANTKIVPTTVDCEIYAPKESQSQKPVLGWIGSPTTWTYCLPMVEMLAGLVREEKMTMQVIGAGSAADKTLPFVFREWSQAREVAEIQQMDIGIMPLRDDKWARGKSGYKLIQYMACGLPVIASPVGVNREIVEDGVNGFLAETESEWRAAIERLAGDAALRKRMGQAGRAKAEKQFSIQVFGPYIAEQIQALLSQA